MDVVGVEGKGAFVESGAVECDEWLFVDNNVYLV